MTDLVTSITVEIPTAVAQKIAETGEGTLAETALVALKLYHGIGAPARTLLAELAEHHKLTTAKTLRVAIEHLKKDGARMHLGAGPVGRPKINEDRDAEIYSRTKTGSTQASIAAEFGLSLVRVGQIVARQRAELKEAIPQRVEATSPTVSLNVAVDQGASIELMAEKYGIPLEQAQEMHAKYRAHLPANPTMGDRINTARLIDQKAHEVLMLKDSPPAPRKLAVIPPSMRNPELYAALKPIEPVDLENLDNHIFSDDFEF